MQPIGAIVSPSRRPLIDARIGAAARPRTFSPAPADPCSVTPKDRTINLARERPGAFEGSATHAHHGRRQGGDPGSAGGVLLPPRRFPLWRDGGVVYRRRHLGYGV